MKDKIIMLIIGALLGAVIATGAFLIYSKSSCNNEQMPQGNPPSIPSGQSNEQREKPSDNNN